MAATRAIVASPPLPCGRRRLTVRPEAGGVRVVLRGERFDRPATELARVAERLGTPA